MKDSTNENRNCFAVSVADLEPPTCDALLGKEKMQRLDSPCRIHLHSKRHRLVDVDNLSAKYVIDGLVLAGVLSDDTPAFVKEVTQTQEKVSTSSPETVTVTITEIRDEKKCTGSAQAGP